MALKPPLSWLASTVLVVVTLGVLWTGSLAALLAVGWGLDRTISVATNILDPYLCLSDFCQEVKEAKRFQRWCSDNKQICHQVYQQALREPDRY